MDSTDPEFGYRIEELLGVIHGSAGQFALSAERFEDSRQIAVVENSPLLTALALRHLGGLASCWTEPATIMPILDQAHTLNRDLGLAPGSDRP